MSSNEYQIDPEDLFSGCIYPLYKESSHKLFKILPKRVKSRINFHHIYVTDMFDKSINPNVSIDGETLAFFIEKGRTIYIRPKNIFSEEAIIGLLAHEVAHAYLFYSSPIIKLISKIYYKMVLYYDTSKKLRYRHYKESDKIIEYQVDYMVRKWGFRNFQEILWKEMVEKGKDKSTY